MNGAACRFGLCVVVGALAVGFHSTLSGQQTPQESRQGLRAAAGLEATLWASEPALANPTNMAIDERGRVWVLEAVNYRRRLRRQPDVRPEGDRIVILEDTDGDGRPTRARCSISIPTSGLRSASRSSAIASSCRSPRT